MTSGAPEPRPAIRRGGELVADWSPLRHDRGFRAQWLGQLGSAVGREAARYAFPIQVYLLTDSLSLLGAVAALQLAATVVLSLSSGALSDLFDRRLILVSTLGIMAAVSAALLGLALVERPPIELVVLLGVIVTTLFTMEQPARISSVPRLVPQERLPAAIALTSLNFQAMTVIGPALAALMFGIAGIAGAYLVQFVAYTWAAIASARMPSLPPAGRSGRSTLGMLGDSFRFVLDRRIILSTFAIDLNAMILALPLGSLLPVLLIEAYGIPPEAVGLLLSARGAGAVLSAVLSGWTRSLQSLGMALIAVVVVYCGATLALGLTTSSVLLALPLMALTGAADVASAILRNTIIQTATPDDMRGRVTAIHVLSSAGGPRVGDVRAAIMAEAMGAAATLAIGGLLAIGGVALVARAFPELRAYRLDRSPAAASPARAAPEP